MHSEMTDSTSLQLSMYARVPDTNSFKSTEGATVSLVAACRLYECWAKVEGCMVG